MQFPWRPCRAGLPRLIQRFYRFPQLALASAEDHKARSPTDPQCRAQFAHEPKPEWEFSVLRPLDFRRRHRPRPAEVWGPLADSPCGEAGLRSYRKARCLRREILGGTRLGYHEELQTAAGSIRHLVR